LGPAAAFAEEGVLVFSGEGPALPAGLFETLPLSLEDEATFTRFVDKFRAILPRAQLAFRGSSATGVKWRTGKPFDEASDIDLAIVDEDLFAKASELGLKFRVDGSRTGPLKDFQLDKLGLGPVRDALSELVDRDVSFMIYRSMDDVLARGPAIVVPAL
jgi:hypothetical protein